MPPKGKRRNKELRRSPRKPRSFQNESERIAYYALKSLLKQKYIDFFIYAEHGDRLDSAHIDFILGKKKKMIALQIKGCEEAAQKHRRKYPEIPVLVINNINNALMKGHMNGIANNILKIFEKELRSHEHILDPRTIETIRHRIAEEGCLDLSPFGKAL